MTNPSLSGRGKSLQEFEPEDSAEAFGGPVNLLMPKLFSRTPLRPEMQGPVAIVDIGSNSVRLVVYDGLTRAPTPIFNEKSSAASATASRRRASFRRPASKRRSPRCGVSGRSSESWMCSRSMLSRPPPRAMPRTGRHFVAARPPRSARRSCFVRPPRGRAFGARRHLRLS